jgi:hypothetical protein
VDVWPPLRSFDRHHPRVDCNWVLPGGMATEEEKVSPSFDLWLDGKEMEDSAGWKQEVKFDFGLFLSNDAYASWVSDHITRTLANLAREVEEIGTMVSAQQIECARE